MVAARDKDNTRARDRERYQKDKSKRHALIRRYMDRYPEKVAARTAVANALRDGRLTKAPCEKCGAEPAHAHHDNYAFPLDVRWLCQQHHTEVHLPDLVRKFE
jgi:hypothetical protein